jgi:glycosyltransferase involved in cell wall biosynthesis
VEEVLRRQADCFDVVYLHRGGNAADYMGLVRRHCPKARVLYGVADLHHLRLERQAGVEDRPELLARSRRLQFAECMAAAAADAVLTHSVMEAAALRRAVPGARVHVVPWEVPVRPGLASFRRRRGVAFVGGYGHAPNVDAARFLADEVMPLVWRQAPDLSCRLVGSLMPDSVRALARPGLEVVGAVADLNAMLNAVRLTVAPLRYGAGLKGKVLDSFAAGVPCVMTPVAAEGLALPPVLQALVAEDAAGLAALILRVHKDSAFHRAASQAGLALVEDGFTQAAVTESLRGAVAVRHEVVAFPPAAASAEQGRAG